eukprot:scaffold2550_cov48-Attheya_sp.AAC.3
MSFTYGQQSTVQYQEEGRKDEKIHWLVFWSSSSASTDATTSTVNAAEETTRGEPPIRRTVSFQPGDDAGDKLSKSSFFQKGTGGGKAIRVLIIVLIIICCIRVGYIFSEPIDAKVNQ